MSLTWPEIVSIVQQRRQARHPLIEQMMAVRERYNGSYVIPGFENLPALTPALVQEAVDFPALVAAGPDFSINCPAVDASKNTGVRSLEYADKRRKALGYSLFKSDFKNQLHRAYRHLAGYSTTAIVVIADLENECPHVQVRDPLHAFPEPKAPEDTSPVRNCAFIYGKSAEWIRDTYPEAREVVPPSSRGESTMWDICEWIDAEDIVVGLVGPRDRTYAGDLRENHLKELRRWKNKAGMCTVIIPERVSLDIVRSSVASMVANVDLLGRLTALDIMATEKSIWPDRYMIGTPGQTPILVNGEWHDGRTGKVNILKDVAAVGDIRGTPDPNNKITIDRQERGFRISTGLVPQAGGESYGALRTGRGLDALMSAAVDPKIRELHELMESRLAQVNEAIFAVYEGYWPNKKYEVFSGWVGDRGMAEFTPADHFETRFNFVKYPVAGADVQGTTIILAQMHGAGLISRDTAMTRHPLIEDKEAEKRQRNLEDADEAARVAWLNQASDPASGVSWEDHKVMHDALAAGKGWAEASGEVQRAKQERQAAAPAAVPEGMLAPPEAMAGMNPVPESPLPPTTAPPNDSMEAIRQLVSALEQPAA